MKHDQEPTLDGIYLKLNGYRAELAVAVGKTVNTIEIDREDVDRLLTHLTALRDWMCRHDEEVE